MPSLKPMSATSPAYRLFRASALLTAALLASLPLWSDAPEVPDAPDGGTPAAREAPSVLADAATLEPGAVASLTVPERPPEWQETRCDAKRREVSINGGCYKEQAGKPPCAEGEFEHDGKCWAAVAKRAQPLRSIGQ